MTLPTPNLDDRHFQDLVDESKRLVQQRCPEWTAHNVSDPGITLIETFAMLVDQLLYRLNQVPDRLYVRFLELVGVRLQPPQAAHVDVTFWLSAPQTQTVVVPAETETATARTEPAGAVVFTTVRPLTILPTAVAHVATAPDGGSVVDHSTNLDTGEEFACFSALPRPGDALLVGLTAAAPACAVTLRVDCEVEGIGVDPRNPPLLWEAHDGEAWAACECAKDTTGGLNRSGDLTLHVPPGHAESVMGQHRAGWLRCRVTPPGPSQPAYTASPRIRAVEGFTVGGTVPALHAATLHDEPLGVSDGVPGQRFQVKHPPVLLTPADPMVVEVGVGDEWQPWHRVGHFADSGPDDRHLVVDATTGEISLGPAVRQPDGTLRRYGATPPAGASLRVHRYRTGGGRGGNLAARMIDTVRGSIPYVARVENRVPAEGGRDGESIEDAKVRGPLELRTLDRAVTLDDYEQLARTAGPDVGRVRAVATPEPGGVRLLVVPRYVGDEVGQVQPDQLRPSDRLLGQLAAHLDARRVIGTRLSVEPPHYKGVTVVAQVTPQTGVDPVRLRRDCLAALYDHLDILAGGTSGLGWPFGRPVQVGDLFGVLARVRGTEVVDAVRMFPADPATGDRGDEATRIELSETALPLSFDHQVEVRDS